MKRNHVLWLVAGLFGLAFSVSGGVVNPPSGGVTVASNAAMSKFAAPYASTIYFPSTSTTYKTVFSGIGVRKYLAQPSVVASGRGTLFAAMRVGTTHQSDQGDVYIIEMDLLNNIIATNLIYHDASGYDARNTTLKRTAAGTLLCAFNVFHYQDTTWPTNCLRVLRSTDYGATWTTNAPGIAGSDANTAGQIAQLGNGDILLPYSTEITNATYWTSWALISKDDGVTWSAPYLVANLASYGHDADEPSLYPIPGTASGCVANVRGDTGSVTNWVLRSSDGGVTWGTPTPTFQCLSKISTLVMSNGLCVYSYRGSVANSPLTFCTSADTGLTYSAATVLDSRHTQMQYSSGLEIAPGMVALYYGYQDSSGTNSPLFVRYGSAGGMAPDGSIISLLKGATPLTDSNAFARSVTVNGATSNVVAGNINLGTISSGGGSGVTNGQSGVSFADLTVTGTVTSTYLDARYMVREYALGEMLLNASTRGVADAAIGSKPSIKCTKGNNQNFLWSVGIVPSGVTKCVTTATLQSTNEVGSSNIYVSCIGGCLTNATGSAISSTVYGTIVATNREQVVTFTNTVATGGRMVNQFSAENTSTNYTAGVPVWVLQISSRWAP